MVKKKIDNRIRVMIENGVKLNYRTMFVIIGDRARDQVPILYDILIKSSVKARPPVLWCYKNKDEVISNHGKKRAKKIAAGKIDVNEADLFDSFRVSTTIHGRYYTDTHSVLGKTYGVCVLQDFEALTPNLLARTIETVEGGGLIIFLLKTLQSLKQLFTMSMDVHKRFRTEAHQTVTCRFNERLILSLADCNRCLVVNDDLTVLPLSSKTINVDAVNPNDIRSSENDELMLELRNALSDTPPVGPLVNLCKTYDQAKAVAQFIESLAEKQLKPPLSLTAARGRGKSAAMGLSVAAAIAFGYVNVYVTSPHPENLITFFEFVLRGFDALEYQEHTDYTIIRSTNVDYKKTIIRINIMRSSRQTIQYIAPIDTSMLNAADLLIIDEAAAIPLPLVKKMLGPYLIFMASTINGYEGTGRSLSLKLISQLQKENNAQPPITLDESIRYRDGDDVEGWLVKLLCLDASVVSPISSGCPTPEVCELYYIDRDALFSYHKAAEVFLQRIVAIYVASHYKNSPNDLQMLSDAPAHHIFCLLGPIACKDQLPEVLVVVQVAFEGELTSQTIDNSLGRGKKASGDLIPWIIAEQFGDREFPKLCGLRIVRIATHPNYQRMGYGKRAIQLLKDYYVGKFADLTEKDNKIEYTSTCNAKAGFDGGIEEIEDEQLDLLKEQIRPRRKVPTLLKRLSERLSERIDYFGTSFGLTHELLKFWKQLGFVPLYISQKANDLTGEHSCIMIHTLEFTNKVKKKSRSMENAQIEWLSLYFNDFRRRFLKLLARSFRQFATSLGLSVMDNKWVNFEQNELTKAMLDVYFLPHDLQRLELYARNQVEFRLIIDLLADISTMYFQGRMQGLPIDTLQKAILLGIGVQGKTVDDIAVELNMLGNQILAKLYDLLKKVSKHFGTIFEADIEHTTLKETKTNRSSKNNGKELKQIEISLNDELDESARELTKKQREDLRRLKVASCEQFAIKGTDEDWKRVLSTKDDESKVNIISMKSGVKRLDAITIENKEYNSLQNEERKHPKKKMRFSTKVKKQRK